jgi:hypothetical protein
MVMVRNRNRPDLMGLISYLFPYRFNLGRINRSSTGGLGPSGGGGVRSLVSAIFSNFIHLLLIPARERKRFQRRKKEKFQEYIYNNKKTPRTNALQCNAIVIIHSDFGFEFWYRG